MAVLEERIKRSNIARKLAAKTLKAKLESMNELHARIERMDNTFMTKEASAIKLDVLAAEINMLKLTGAEIRSKADQKSVDESVATVQHNVTNVIIFSVITAVVGILGVCIGVAGLLFNYLK